MCAIAGVLRLEAQEAVRGKMLATMARRGPDGNGVFEEGECTLLHSRLAVIDPEGGAQPMSRGDFVLVYNGELYNTDALRRELEGQGFRFRGHSDTEVVLQGFIRWGEGCLERFNGIYAFAVWDRKRKRLFLARDRIGVKPLFYCLHRGGLVFASEIKTILTYPGIRAQLDREGAMELLMLGPGRLPGSGVFRGIRELEPGCCGWYEQGSLKIRRYWQLRDREHLESFEETAAHVRHLVTDAIKGQMVSDVPIGAFLSGGLDSSIICAVCAEEMKTRGEKLPTFSVDYQNNDLFFRPGKFQPNSDGAYIDIMRSFLNPDHHGTVLSAEDLNLVLEESTRARDLPGMGDVDFSLFAFCREIRREVKVALSGECADEIFGGYPWYRDPEVRAMDGFPWSQNVSQRASLLHPSLRRGAHPEEFVMDAYRDTCRRSDVLPGTPPEERRMKEMVNLNFRWFMQTLLDRKDRMSMYHSLEVRVPFCDYRIAEYLYSVPWQYKDYQGREKGLLRCAVEGLLPEQVLHRKKSPYPKTFDPAYEQIMEGRLKEILADSASPLHALVDTAALQVWLEHEDSWPWYGQLMRRPQTMAYFIQMDYWFRCYGVTFAF